MKSLLVATLAAVAFGDFYLQHPRGSNNRLDGESRDRRNGRRLFDSANNGRGGYNRGGGRMYYYEGSEIPFIWTQDMSCADDQQTCTYVIQYYCHEHLRDGWYTDSTMYETIPYSHDNTMEADDCRVDMRRFGTEYGSSDWEHGNCTLDYRYGMHEGREYYEECRATSRNFGLFTAEQNLPQGRSGAIYTRTNPSATRFGYECPEERDYYPYWNPSPWRDLAVITDEPSRCDAFREESQNVKPRYVCRFGQAMHDYARERRWTGYVPITEEECTRPAADRLVTNENGEPLNIGIWEMVPAHGIEPPLCLTPDHSRANTLSNSYDNFGHESQFNWTIPYGFTEQFAKEIESERCVIRIRHNTTGRDAGFLDHGYASPTSVQSGFADSKMNSVDEEGNFNRDFPTQIPVWEHYGLPKPVEAFTRENFENGDYGNGYVFGNEPKVDIFGGLIPGNRVYLNLAINTQKYPRNFQDRTHGFVIRKRPANLEGYDIINLSVKGKRGNIVQTWPAHEYDFQPSPLEVKSGSLIHIQWNGANTNPRNNAGEGPQGYDRSNIVVLGPQVYPEAPKIDPTTGEPMLTFGQYGRSYPAHFGYNPLNPKTPDYMEGQEQGRFLGWEWQDCFTLALPSLYTPYFDFGLKQVTASVKTTYNFLSTRNNNFSNRSQKGKITILPRTAEDGPEPAAPLIKSREAMLSIPGKAFIEFDRDERLSHNQIIELEQGPCEPEYASCWFKVWPRVLSMPGEMSTGWGMTQLNIYHEWRPFMYGRIYWAEYPGDTLIEMMTEEDSFSWGTTGRATVWINQGGYYVVENEVNMTAVGGAIVGLVVTAIVAFFMYKRFGCRFIGGTKFHGARDPLMEEGAGAVPRSDAVPPPATTSTTVTTDTA